jgi:lactate 2-monooxygenase
MKAKPKALLPLGAVWQREIYHRGVTREPNVTPLPLRQLALTAKEKLGERAWGYLAGGAGAEWTMRANRQAFYRWRIVPRMLHDISQRDLSIELLGMKLPAPLLLGPVGVQELFHPEAEVAVARAAAALGIPFSLSTVSSKSIEEVGNALGTTPGLFQLYWGRDREVSASMVKRAEAAGYKAIILTLDTPMLAWRERDLSRAYLPFLHGQGLANYRTDPVFRSQIKVPPEEDLRATITRWSEIFSNPSLNWSDLKWLRQQTRLPIVLKGILHPEDAALALDAGADGIIVSNHGGRQVDGSIAALDALPGVVAAVKGRAPVLFDSGIRRGADAVKALALGASAVLLARPYIWGLAVAGEAGVREVLLNFVADFDLTLALSGHRCCQDLGQGTLIKDC